MRYYAVLLILFLMGQKNFSQNLDISNDTTTIDTRKINSKSPINDSFPLKCKIFRIKKINNAYIIDIWNEPQDYIYTIISLKSKTQNFKKIKRGKQYEFVLLAYYPILRAGHILHDYTIDGVRIRFRRFKSQMQLYRRVKKINIFIDRKRK